MPGTQPPPPPEGGSSRQRATVKAEPDPLITLKVVDQEGRRAFHTMRISDRLQGVMDAYYKKVPQVTYGTGTFMFDGSIRLRGEKTAAEFDLEDGDSIDFFETQVGGVR
jgi:small ubiquitin-related modifier